MPNDRLECFGMRRDALVVHGWHNDADISLTRSVPAVATDDSYNRGADFLGEIQCGYKIRADIPFRVATADGKNENRVVIRQPASYQPLDENRLPAVVVGPGRQFGNVVGRRVTFEAADLSEIVDRVRSVGNASADAENEQSPAARTHFVQKCDRVLNHLRVEARDDLFNFFKIVRGKAHHSEPRLAHLRRIGVQRLGYGRVQLGRVDRYQLILDFEGE